VADLRGHRLDIAIALLGNRLDVLWVMGQAARQTDSKMTMDVYAQLQQRFKRGHGTALDRLVDQSREQLYGAEFGSFERRDGALLGPAPADPREILRPQHAGDGLAEPEGPRRPRASATQSWIALAWPASW
jgi:hypothetical protein